VAALTTAYLDIRRRINHLALQEEEPVVGNDEFLEERKTVAAIWDRLIGADEK
jgi:glutamine synthetase adenylyltransferase